GTGRSNFGVDLGQTARVGGYQVTYVGKEMNSEGRPMYLLDVQDPSGDNYRLSPVVYQSHTEQWIQHPDLKLGADKDLFVAVSPAAMFDESDAPNQLQLAKNDTTVVGDRFRVYFSGFDLVSDAGHSDSQQIVVGASLQVMNLETTEVRDIRPLYIVEPDRSVRFEPARIDEWNVGFSFIGMNVDTGAVQLEVDGVEAAPQEWIVVQAYEKPLINLVWIGIIVLSLGFVLAIYRRAGDLKVPSAA
ncbi:MAG: cytochrome C assembly protein, partial [Rhodothermales bacterium]|nr:cytochrome C assembly protein [Rhodothermales bacterium]